VTLHAARRGARGPATRTRSRPPGKVALLLGQANLRRAAHRAERIGVPQLGWARAAHATSRPVAWLRFVPGRRAAFRGGKSCGAPVRSGRRRSMMLDRPGPASVRSLLLDVDPSRCAVRLSPVAYYLRPLKSNPARYGIRLARCRTSHTILPLLVFCYHCGWSYCSSLILWF
jgi:hypothetical protein